jgi:hypothetical protein
MNLTFLQMLTAIFILNTGAVKVLFVRLYSH